jgi:hypothetical protein
MNPTRLLGIAADHLAAARRFREAGADANRSRDSDIAAQILLDRARKLMGKRRPNAPQRRLLKLIKRFYSQ